MFSYLCYSPSCGLSHPMFGRYKLCYYRFGELTTEYGKPPGYGTCLPFFLAICVSWQVQGCLIFFFCLELKMPILLLCCISELVCIQFITLLGFLLYKVESMLVCYSLHIDDMIPFQMTKIHYSSQRI
jgi:hypothetical protein